MSDVLTIDAPDGVDAGAWGAAVSALRQACGWHVAPVVTSTARVRVEGGVIVLPSLRVTRVVEVKWRGQFIDPSRYELMPEPVIYLRGHALSREPVVVEVTFEHGYDEMPGELLSLLGAAASRGSAGSLVTQVGQVKFGGSGILPGAAEAMAAAPALARYRLGPRP